MDILLTHGFFLQEDPVELRIMKPYPPLGILSISAYLKARGFRVGVFDTTFRSFFDFTEVLERDRPPVVGIYANLMTRSRVLQMMAAAGAGGATVILGGPEPAVYPEEYLKRGADIIVAGEAEVTLGELLPALQRGDRNGLDAVSGIIFRRQDGTVAHTPARPLTEDLDSFPDPDRDAVDIDRYLGAWRARHGAGSVSLICARGCPYSCTWCSRSVFGNTHRRRSPLRVALEVAGIVERYHPDQLWYADDVFTIRHPWLFAYAAELKRLGLRIPFECITRADRLSSEVIDLLSEMGCFRVWLGAESGSQRVLDAMRRGVTVDRLQEVTHALRHKGIETGIFVMLGYEGENLPDLEATLAHLKRSCPDIFLTTVSYPVKGTEYYRQVSDRLIATANWEAGSDRDFGVRGRHTRRYYSFAARWMAHSVSLHKERQDGRHWGRLGREAAAACFARMGMLLCRNRREGAERGAAGPVRTAVRS